MHTQHIFSDYYIIVANGSEQLYGMTHNLPTACQRGSIFLSWLFFPPLLTCTDLINVP